MTRLKTRGKHIINRIAAICGGCGGCGDFFLIHEILQTKNERRIHGEDLTANTRTPRSPRKLRIPSHLIRVVPSTFVLARRRDLKGEKGGKGDIVLGGSVPQAPGSLGGSRARWAGMTRLGTRGGTE